MPRPFFFHHLSNQLGVTQEVPSSTSNSSENDAADNEKRTGIYNFLQVPFNLEPLLVLGYVTCLDCFLQLITFLPIRVLFALVTLARGRNLTRGQQCNLLRALLVATVSFVLLKLDMSQTYHMVRNQAMLKLYVIFNLLEVFDKLCASFGQDILDSLDSAAVSRRRWRGGLALDFFIALVYTLLHTMVLFYHSVALNIALNSHSNLLITLLISNNFVELKGNVFKKVERENLFQISCSDIVERFQMSVYLWLVGLQFVFVQKVEASAAEWRELAMSFIMIIASEFSVDWIKHAFVIKFNRISPTVYFAFIRILCEDTCRPVAASATKDTAASNATEDSAGAKNVAEKVDAVAGKTPAEPLTPYPGAPVRRRSLGAHVPKHAEAGEFSTLPAARMGFVPLPLLCLVIRVVGLDVAPRLYFGHPSGALLCLLIWLVLCFVKMLTSVTLLGVAAARVEAAAADDTPVDFLSGIERYTLHGKRVM